MIFAAQSATLFIETSSFYYASGATIAIFLFWNKYVWPWLRPKFHAIRDRHLLYSGRPAIEGVTPEVLPLARRLKRFELRLDENVETTKRLDDGQKAIVDRMDQHDVKVSAIDETVGSIESKVDQMSRKIDQLFENGGDTNSPGDILARMARATPGVYLDNPRDEEGTRRSGRQT
jgi:hypothetical protein